MTPDYKGPGHNAPSQLEKHVTKKINRLEQLMFRAPDISPYEDYRTVRDLLRKLPELKSSLEEEQVPSEEVISVVLDLERAMKRLTLYEQEVVYKNCVLRRPAWSVAKDYGTYQTKISSDVINALCKMVVFLNQ